MTENEQIAEIARTICRNFDRENNKCLCDLENSTCNLECWAGRGPAKDLYNAGYRKVERGEWKLGKSGCMYFCPKCNYAAHPREAEEWNSCPRCGANMRGEMG